MAVAERRPGYSGHDAEDRPRSIIDPVDRVTHSGCGWGVALVARRDQIVECRLRLFRWQRRQSASRTDKIPESRVVLTFVGDYLFKNCDAGFIPKRLELLAILCDVSTFIDLKSSKREIRTADTISERVRMARRIARFILDSIPPSDLIRPAQRSAWCFSAVARPRSALRRCGSGSLLERAV